ncbi:hypothetical protein B0T22DRAFT_471010 [Podospora appendiculata]|uniref:Uncharacterized protein n=1 Tax=Podospora appendiculata TaxID=314037 RepID=A0AAE0X177_9PEZI|nr:hypothetical protein B0T22DRAFT_471010 [Podospora appendiculata]
MSERASSSPSSPSAHEDDGMWSIGKPKWHPVTPAWCCLVPGWGLDRSMGFRLCWKRIMEGPPFVSSNGAGQSSRPMLNCMLHVALAGCDVVLVALGLTVEFLAARQDGICFPVRFLMCFSFPRGVDQWRGAWPPPAPRSERWSPPGAPQQRVFAPSKCGVCFSFLPRSEEHKEKPGDPGSSEVAKGWAFPRPGSPSRI